MRLTLVFILKTTGRFLLVSRALAFLLNEAVRRIASTANAAQPFTSRHVAKGLFAIISFLFSP